MPASRIDIKNLTMEFGDARPLDNVSLEIAAGEFLTLLGPSGCGKSTTMRCVAGLQEPTSGDILINGKDVKDTPAYKRDVGFVFQNWALFPHLNVLKNIEFGLRLRSISADERKKRALEALDQVQLSGYQDRMPAQLSGGQQQRVALARAIVIRPGILMFDEPLSNLDAKLRKEMRIELKRLREQLDVTSIYVTHDQEEALTLSDRIALLYQGRIQQLAPPSEIYNRPVNRFVAEFMGYENFIPVEITGTAGDKIGVMSKFGGQEFNKIPGQVDYKDGDKAQIAMRASSIVLTKGDHGTVSDYLYYGDTTSYYLSIPGIGNLQATQEGLPAYEVGDSIGISWGSNGVALVPDAKASSGSVVGTV